MRANIAFAFVTAFVVLLVLTIYKAPDPFADESKRFLDRAGFVSEVGGQMKQLFPDAVIVSDTMAVRCVKRDGAQFGQRQLLKSNGDVIEYKQWNWCWR